MNKRFLLYLRLASSFLFVLLLISVSLLAAADESSSLPAPPVAKKVPKVAEINGQKLVDNYYWLRDKI